MSIRPVTGADYKPADIVSLLAARTASTGGEYESCPLCEQGVTEEQGIFATMTFEQHDAECPWRLAVEWVSANIAIG